MTKHKHRYRPAIKYGYGCIDAMNVLLKLAISKVIIIMLVVQVTYTGHLKAQDIAPEGLSLWALSLQPSLNRINVIDRKFSSARYSGAIPGISLSVDVTQRTVSRKLHVDFSKGALNMQENSRFLLNHTSFYIGYAQLYKLGRSLAPFSIKAGGSFTVDYAERNYEAFINSDLSYEFAASLNAAAELSYSFQNSLEGFRVAARFRVPVLSAIQQPSFASDGPDSDPEKKGFQPSSLFKDSEFASFSKYFRISNHMTLEKEIGSRHKLALVYSWNYYQFTTSREVRSAQHLMGLSYSFIL
ncbi:MAG: hypothetical protein H7Y03_12975 [Chitinophagaceae bacterium]|nr:hypothetical protein [Chitinophagaceae bacterium]